MRKIIIAIDGHSSCGKSTTAKALAKDIGYAYIDTGAMYRAVTLYFLANHIELDDSAAVAHALDNITIDFKYSKKTDLNEVYLNGLNVEQEIRTLEIAGKVSKVATIAAVRHKLVNNQQGMGYKKALVMDGRDIATNVFPDAELKIFMTASLVIRAQRRYKELIDRGDKITLEEVSKNLAERDYIDSNRKESPLIQAEDALVLDTSDHTLESQVAWARKQYLARILLA